MTEAADIIQAQTDQASTAQSLTLAATALSAAAAGVQQAQAAVTVAINANQAVGVDLTQAAIDEGPVVNPPPVNPPPVNPPPAATVPYPGSFWYQPIPASPRLDNMSQASVSRLVADIRQYYGDIAVNDESSTPTVIIAPPGTPLVPVKITGNGGSWVGTIQVPIPAWAQPDPNGSDHEMVVWDQANHMEWEFWVVADPSGGWTARTYTQTDTSGSAGVDVLGGQMGGCSASGLPYLPGVLTDADVKAGVANHALLIGMVSTNGQYVPPAIRADGNTSGGVPQGTHFFWPANVKFTSSNPVAQCVFNTGRVYGFYLVDTAGACVVYAENGESYVVAPGEGKDPWPADEAGQADWQVINGLPWSQLEVLAHP